MNKIIIYSISLLILLTGFSFTAKAVRAYPNPITVTQPDGTTITIQMHGDEFLNWTTCGGSLVQKGRDGFYYKAQFDANGKIITTNVRASGMGGLQGFSNSTVTPPAISYIYAANKREEAMKPFLTRTSSDKIISVGKKKFVILLIEFSDLPFTVSNTNTAFTNLMMQEGYSTNGGTGSSRDYFLENSTSLFDPQFDIYGPIKASNGYAYYTNNEGELIKEACRKIDNEVDFSQYDNDGDGTIDNLFFFFAGHNAAEGAGNDHIWPHAYYVYNLNLDGKNFGRYACTSEYSGASGTRMAGIGTFCHEFGHVIGLPDFYDTDYEKNGQGMGLLNFSLMSSGSYNNGGKTPPFINSLERNMLEWMGEPTEIKTPGDYSLKTVENNAGYFIPTQNSGEYFLLENRQKNGWDKYLPSAGLIIYHVDKSNNIVGGTTAAQLWSSRRNINCYAEHQCFDIVESVFPESSASQSGYDSTFPGRKNNTSFTQTSSPAAVTWAGKSAGFELTNITKDGTFTFTKNTKKSLKGIVKNSRGERVSEAKVSIVPIKISPTNLKVNGTALLKTKRLDTSIELITNEKGEFSTSITGYDEISISTSCIGYNDYFKTLSTSIAGEYSIDILLTTPIEDASYPIIKHNSGDKTSYGIRSSVYAAVEFTEAELKAKGLVGKGLKNISFTINGTKADEVKALVYFGDECVYSKAPIRIYFGSPNIQDLSSSNLIIPSDKSLKIGYYIKNPDSNTPMVADDGPNVSGGFLYSTDGITWNDAHKESAQIDCNLIISGTAFNSENVFYEMGYCIIANPKTEYKVGDKFQLRLIEGNNKPTSIKWFFNNESKTDGSMINLTAGSHIVKAEITYSNGNKETLFQEIKVK